MKRIVLSFVVITVLFASSAQAQTQTAPASGLRTDWNLQMDDVQKKILSLAEAIPAEKYSWRPAEGVRSVGEVFVHIAGGNYFLPTFSGATPPPGFSRDAEKTVTEKAKIIELMKDSFAHARAAFEKLSDADMEKSVDFFGQKMTLRNLYLTVLMHLHEHLGQSIAYARTNDIAPPWSAGGSGAAE